MYDVLMSRTASKRMERASSTHAYLTGMGELACIRSPEINVAVVQRALPAHLRTALRRAVGTCEIRCSYEGSVRTLDTSALLGASFEPEVLEPLGEDIASLAIAYARAARKEHLKISLHTVTDDACRKFHADYVDLRLLCTYVGPGTEVLDEPGLRRLEMENADPHLVANPKIRGGAALFRAGEGDVVLLKGRAYRGNADRGAVHRSPPIEAAGERRLVLKIDGGTCGC